CMPGGTSCVDSLLALGSCPPWPCCSTGFTIWVASLSPAGSGGVWPGCTTSVGSGASPNGVFCCWSGPLGGPPWFSCCGFGGSGALMWVQSPLKTTSDDVTPYVSRLISSLSTRYRITASSAGKAPGVLRSLSRDRGYSEAKNASKSCRVTTPTGRPSSSTRAPSASANALIAACTGSPAPIVGNGADMCRSSRSDNSALPENNAASNSRSLTAPTTSAAITGGSAETTGIWLTPYSRRICTASATVSFGWVCTRSGSDPSLRRSTSPTVAWLDSGGRNPCLAIQESENTLVR